MLAAVVVAWFAIGAVQAIDTSRASNLVSPGSRLSPAAARHAGSLLSSAGFLNPDRSVDVLRSQLDLEQGRPVAARNRLIGLVRSEPDNLDAWIWLARASVGDLRWFYAAAYRIRQLVPPVPAAR